MRDKQTCVKTQLWPSQSTNTELFIDRTEVFYIGEMRIRIMTIMSWRSLIGGTSLPCAEMISWHERCGNERSGVSLYWNEFGGNVKETENFNWNITQIKKELELSVFYDNTHYPENTLEKSDFKYLAQAKIKRNLMQMLCFFCWQAAFHQNWSSCWLRCNIGYILIKKLTNIAF